MAKMAVISRISGSIAHISASHLLESYRLSTNHRPYVGVRDICFSATARDFEKIQARTAKDGSSAGKRERGDGGCGGGLGV